MDGEYHISLNENAQPTTHPPHKVPLSLVPKLKDTLEKLTKQGVAKFIKRLTG